MKRAPRATSFGGLIWYPCQRLFWLKGLSVQLLFKNLLVPPARPISWLQPIPISCVTIHQLIVFPVFFTEVGFRMSRRLSHALEQCFLRVTVASILSSRFRVVSVLIGVFSRRLGKIALQKGNHASNCRWLKNERSSRLNASPGSSENRRLNKFRVNLAFFKKEEPVPWVKCWDLRVPASFA